MLRKISRTLNVKLFSTLPSQKPSAPSKFGLLWGVSSVVLFAGSLSFGYQAVVSYEANAVQKAHVQKDHPEVAAMLESLVGRLHQMGLMATTPTPKVTLESTKTVPKSADAAPLIETKPEPVTEAEKQTPVSVDKQATISHSVDGGATTTHDINVINNLHEPSASIDHELPTINNSEAKSEISEDVVHVEVHPNQSVLPAHQETFVTPEVIHAPSPVENAAVSHSHIHDAVHDTVQSIHTQAEHYHSGLPVVEAETRAHHVHSDATESAMQEHAHYAAALRKEVEASLLRDLDSLSANELRVRLNTLASELLDRASWEGVRLHEAAKVVEADLIRKFNDLLEAQRVELEKERSSKIIAREIEISQALSTQSQEALVRFESKLHETLRSQFETLQSSLNRELQDISVAQEQEHSIDNLFLLASTRNKHVEQLMIIQEQLLDVVSQLSALGKVSNTMQEQNEAIKRTHKQSSALASLEHALRSSQSVTSEIALVQSVFGEQHEFIDTLIRTLPKEASNTGVPTLTELRSRFKVVREEVRKAAMAPPDAPQIVGQLVGSALATISKPPQGMVRGDGIEEILSRAAFHLDNGRLYEAVQEMNTVSGAMPKRLADDWTAAAVARLRADVASTSVRSLALLLSTEYKQ